MRRDFVGVVGDVQEVLQLFSLWIAVPFIFDRLDALKPYQGFFDLVWSSGA